MWRFFGLCTLSTIAVAAVSQSPTHVTGMLEYLSPTALVVRLEDHREIQVRIPAGNAVPVGDRQVGDLVDVTYREAPRRLDKSLGMMLFVELTELQSFRKPSALELESAEASRVRKFPGNLLVSPPPQISQDAQREDSFSSLRQQVNAYLSHLPEFTAHETTARFVGTEGSEQWSAFDQIQAEVLFTHRHETRTEILRDGNPWTLPYKALPGLSRTSFTGRLMDVFSPRKKVNFLEDGTETLKGHPVVVYSFHAPPDSITHSYVGEQAFWPATDGRVWISKADGRVLQLDTELKDFALDYPLASEREHIVFDYVQIGGTREALPISSQVLWVRRDSGRLALSRNTYTNYRIAEAQPRSLETAEVR